MRFAQVFAVVAAVVASVAAKEEDVTTLTSTTTKTLTVTQCNPTKTDCPYTKYYPAGNTTSHYPTGSAPVDVVTVKPTSTSTAVVTLAATTTRAVTAGAGSVLVQGGLLMGAAGMAVAALL